MRRRWRRRDPARAGLTTEERAALELLERAHGQLPGADWLVGRTTGRSLARRRLVFVMDEFVFLTDAGREALEQERQQGTRPDGRLVQPPPALGADRAYPAGQV